MPALPAGVSATGETVLTGADLLSSWERSDEKSFSSGADCSAYGGATLAADGTYADLHTWAGTLSSAWGCAGVESPGSFTPGSVLQIAEYIPAAANGNIANYPSFWLTDKNWQDEIDVAEAHAWGTTSPIDGEMCLDVHENQGTQNTSPDCVTQKGNAWHTYTLVWAKDGTVTVYYDSTRLGPATVKSPGAQQVIVWNNSNGGQGSIADTVQVAYFASWTLSS